MPSLADLHRSVQITLASGRIGQPVFVRYVLFVKSLNINILSGSVAVVRDWLGEAPERFHSLGNVESGYVSLTIQFKGGATALVSCARTDGERLGADLTILGNHGAIYHESTPESMDDVRLTVEADIARLVEQALNRQQDQENTR